MLPFSGPWTKAGLPKQGQEHGFPFAAISGLAGDGTLGEQTRILDVDGDGVLFSAAYPQAGRVLARVFESPGRAATVSLRFRRGRAALREPDLRGREEGLVGETVALRPWQVRTVWIEPRP